MAGRQAGWDGKGAGQRRATEVLKEWGDYVGGAWVGARQGGRGRAPLERPKEVGVRRAGLEGQSASPNGWAAARTRREARAAGRAAQAVARRSGGLLACAAGRP